MDDHGREWAKAVGRRIRFYRDEAGMDTAGLAAAVGISELTVSRHIRGANLLDGLTLHHYAVVLGVTTDDLTPDSRELVAAASWSRFFWDAPEHEGWVGPTHWLEFEDPADVHAEWAEPLEAREDAIFLPWEAHLDSLGLPLVCSLCAALIVAPSNMCLRCEHV
jgi:transcriptional regulator with XRE-family HTH domain